MPNNLPPINRIADLYEAFAVTNLDGLADVLRNLPAGSTFAAPEWTLSLQTTLRILTVFKDQGVGLRLPV